MSAKEGSGLRVAATAMKSSNSETKSRLIVVSNRVALPGETSTGGLASAMSAALAESGGLWFGWSGKMSSVTGDEVHRVSNGQVDYATIDLSRPDHEQFYTGFSNSALWPLFHYRPDLVNYRRKDLDGYLRVNETFADKLSQLIKPDDVVWIHDYHLIPLGSALRARGVKNRIGFFLHTPLPAAALLIALPKHRALFGSFAGYDLVGVHTARDARSLEDYFLHELGAAMRTKGRIRSPSGRVFKVGVFPISIDTEKVARLAKDASQDVTVKNLKASMVDRSLVIGVDRLDYSKGLADRLRAFSAFLENNGDMQRKVTLLQITPPSRGTVPQYRQIRRELEREAGHINGKYATADWVPVRYVNQSFPHEILAGYYRAAKVAIVTPLRDGMNLVAKEYVASQDPSDPGVLILSEFAGAAHELDGALLVNPNDIDEIVQALEKALRMSRSERLKRWRKMMAVLEKHDLTAWRRNFVDALSSESDLLS
jgi:trehalose 6-phosphate synthase